MNKKQEILESLKSVYDPELGQNIVELQMVRDIVITDGKARLTLALTTLRCPMKEKIIGDVKEAVGSVKGISSIEVELTEMSKDEMDHLFPKHPLVGIKKVKHFVAVGSGKDGVGKTTVAVNLAIALNREGFKVGLLDADMYGPNVPIMLDISEKPGGEDGMILPPEKFGLKIMSIGFFVDESKPIIWRAPLYQRL